MTAAGDLGQAGQSVRVEATSEPVSGGAGAWQAATFHVESDADVHADHWEMHPEADEAV
ncbi:hypothetical protein J2S50_000652 [Streptomyces sp. DSM 40167]|uniref:hypothetical protein n=1 Tax=Streptomyces sp. DSM 40167 TaxID=2817708 RepID=UPI00278662C2|nr:hypothetical protein [Streptomyces sp. DSM 40167]